MKKDNKHRNNSLSKNEIEHLQVLKLVSKHKIGMKVTYAKRAKGTIYINNEEGC